MGEGKDESWGEEGRVKLVKFLGKKEDLQEWEERKLLISEGLNGLGSMLVE